jgi:cell division protein FtsB
MRYLFVLVFFAAFLIIGGTPVQAQTRAQEKAASLRAQLAEVEARQAELQTRLQNLDEKLKPENIENSLAGVGSTHPEDLREQRRRQLEIERNGVRAQIDLLATSHSRLETAIATADADAYRQSASPLKGPAEDALSTAADSAPVTTPQRRARRARKKKVKRSRRAGVVSLKGPGRIPESIYTNAEPGAVATGLKLPQFQRTGVAQLIQTESSSHRRT